MPSNDEFIGCLNDSKQMWLKMFYDIQNLDFPERFEVGKGTTFTIDEYKYKRQFAIKTLDKFKAYFGFDKVTEANFKDIQSKAIKICLQQVGGIDRWIGIDMHNTPVIEEPTRMTRPKAERVKKEKVESELF